MTREEAIQLVTKAVNDAIATTAAVGSAQMALLINGWSVKGMLLTVEVERAPLAETDGITRWTDERFLKELGIGGEDRRGE